MAAATLGILAGLGDAAREHNQRRFQQEEAQKQAFAGDLSRVMESEDWPEQARMAAAQARYQLLSGGVKAKDYQKLWQSIHEASGRLEAEAPEVAAARSDLPSLQHIQKTLPASTPIAAPQPAPAPRNDALGLLAPSVDNEQGQNVFGPTQGTMGLQRPQEPSQNNLLQPPLFGQAVDAQAGQAQQIVSAAPPPTMVYGPTTRAEKNQQAMDMFKQQLQMQQQAGLETFEKEQEIKDRYDKTKQWQPIPEKSRGLYSPITGERQEFEDITSGGPDPDMSPIKMLIWGERQKIKAAGGNPDDPAQIESVVLGATKRLAQAGQVSSQDSLDIRRLALEMADEKAQVQSQNTFTNDIAQFRQEYTNQMKNNVEAAEAAEADIAFLKTATIGADFGAIYKTMRMFDPSSVVREQEFAAGQKIGDWWDANIGNKLQQWRGTGFLTDNARKEMMIAAVTMRKIIKQAQRRLNDRYMPAADAGGLPFDQIGFVGDHTYVPGTNYQPRRLYRSVLDKNGGRTPSGPPSSSPVLDELNKVFGGNQ